MRWRLFRRDEQRLLAGAGCGYQNWIRLDYQAEADMVVNILRDAISTSSQWLRATGRTGVFVLKVLPMLPSRPLDLVTTPPVVERLEYPTREGRAQGDVYRPASRGPHPGMVVCLGVVPFGVDHPQVPRLGEALARAGFAALIYWSPSMRDFCLDPEDIENIALAYGCLLDQPYVDAGRSGLFGTCVGGSFALMAAACPLIRDRVAFVGAFAPYGSLGSLARDIASATRDVGEQRLHWQVDPLTRKVFVYSVTAGLESPEADALRRAYAIESPACDDRHSVTAAGLAVEALLAARSLGEAEAALAKLPQEVQAGLRDLSPINYLHAIHAPLIAICHDRDDAVIPVGESRLLKSTIGARAGLRYTEFAMFEHADPTRRKLSPLRQLREIARFYLWLHAVFRESVALPRSRPT